MAPVDVFTLTGDALPGEARVLAFQGAESLSRPYSFAIHLLLPPAAAAAFEPAAAIGQRATLTLHREDGSPRTWVNGVLAGVELSRSLPWHTIYRAVLVPRLWELSLSRHSRVWVKTSVPALLEDVLKRAGLASGDDYELRLAASYPEREHICQYHESDLDFLSRWMEREGIVYYFEQGEERERLILCDARSAHGPLADEPVRFLPAGAAGTAGLEGLGGLRCRHLGRPSEVRLKDYDHLQPGLDVSGSAPASTAGGGPVVSYGENLLTPAEAKRLARVRAEELLAGQVVYQGTGRVFALRPGYTFELEEHPRAAFNRRYLVTALQHRGQQLGGATDLAKLLDVRADRVYDVDVTAIPDDVQYRPERVTPWPRVQGLEGATIDGPADGSYAQLDEHGRYLVRILFDESGLKDGKASTRVRMLQPHGGNPEGFHFPLRKGTEVFLGFLGGDPDRPVIAAVGPNPLVPSPVTAANHTHNVVQTGGLSRIEIEDLDGAQYIDTSTPPQNTFVHLGAKHAAHDHNIVIWTDGDGLIHTGGNRDIRVGGNQTEDVDGNLTEDYHANQTTHVYASFTETIDAGARQTIHAGSTQTIDGGQTQTIDGGETRKVVGGQTESLSGGRTQSISGSSTETITGSLTQSVLGGVSIQTPAQMMVTATGGLTINAVGGSKFTAAGGVTILAPGGHLSVDNILNHFGAKDWKNYSVFASLLVTKLEFVLVLAAQTFGVKIDLNMVKVDDARIKFETYGNKSKAGGAKKSIAGVAIDKQGAQVEA